MHLSFSYFQLPYSLSYGLYHVVTLLFLYFLVLLVLIMQLFFQDYKILKDLFSSQLAVSLRRVRLQVEESYLDPNYLLIVYFLQGFNCVNVNCHYFEQ